MRWHRPVSVAVLVVLLAGCTPAVVPQPGEPLPSAGAPAVGIAYRMTVICPIDLAVGDTWWRFEDPTNWPTVPPAGIFDNVSDPAPFPGVLVLSSPDRAIFRADVDRSELALVRVDNPVEAGCL